MNYLKLVVLINNLDTSNVQPFGLKHLLSLHILRYCNFFSFYLLCKSLKLFAKLFICLNIKESKWSNDFNC